MVFRLDMPVRPWLHRLISLCAIAALLVGIVPLPLDSSPPVAKDTSKPFPCQNHRCGCRSADQCWKKCCCFTNQQKLAWAKKHRVALPEFVIAAANREQTSETTSPPLCHSQAKQTCQSGKSGHRAKGVSPSVSHASESPANRLTDAQEDVTFVVGLLAQRCRGESTFWNSLPWTILPPAMTISARPEKPIDTWSLTSDESVDVSQRPPVPPPRAV
ncbi:MAG: hypothetical protein O2955_09745 [Planctomycetota bacterium]|nr:hypothetical protein [Planctomycetota bacterium]MDA1212792.1 hypothetical protein [Planctomycetota bacterium]